jgi:hypothetical protein
MSRGRRAAPWRIPGLVVATVTALMALASIYMAVLLHLLGAPRETVVLVRALTVPAHVPVVPVLIPSLSAIIMTVVTISSSTSPDVIAVAMVVPPSSVVGVISPSLRVPLRDSSSPVSGAVARFRICAASAATWVIATTAIGVSVIEVAVLFERVR